MIKLRCWHNEIRTWQKSKWISTPTTPTFLSFLKWRYWTPAERGCSVLLVVVVQGRAGSGWMAFPIGTPDVHQHAWLSCHRALSSSSSSLHDWHDEDGLLRTQRGPGEHILLSYSYNYCQSNLFYRSSVKSVLKQIVKNDGWIQRSEYQSDESLSSNKNARNAEWWPS